MHTNRLFTAAGGLLRPKRWLRRYHYPCFYCSAIKAYPDGRGPSPARGPKNSRRLFFGIIHMRQNFNAVGIFIIGVLAILADCPVVGQLKHKAVALVPDDDPHCNLHEMRTAGQHCIFGFPFGKSRPPDSAAVCQNVPGDILWACSGDHAHRKGLESLFLKIGADHDVQNGEQLLPSRSFRSTHTIKW